MRYTSFVSILTLPFLIATLTSSCVSGRIQHEYVTKGNWSHRRPNFGTGRSHRHKERTLSKFSWVTDERKSTQGALDSEDTSELIRVDHSN